jgi:hypothetical protein
VFKINFEVKLHICIDAWSKVKKTYVFGTYFDICFYLKVYKIQTVYQIQIRNPSLGGSK